MINKPLKNYCTMVRSLWRLPLPPGTAAFLGAASIRCLTDKWRQIKVWPPCLNRGHLWKSSQLQNSPHSQLSGIVWVHSQYYPLVNSPFFLPDRYEPRDHTLINFLFANPYCRDSRAVTYSISQFICTISSCPKLRLLMHVISGQSPVHPGLWNNPAKHL